jgi:hypothetical protein
VHSQPLDCRTRGTTDAIANEAPRGAARVFSEPDQAGSAAPCGT